MREAGGSWGGRPVSSWFGKSNPVGGSARPGRTPGRVPSRVVSFEHELRVCLDLVLGTTTPEPEYDALVFTQIRAGALHHSVNGNLCDGR